MPGAEHLTPIAVETVAAGDVLVFRLRATGTAKRAGSRGRRSHGACAGRNAVAWR